MLLIFSLQRLVLIQMVSLISKVLGKNLPFLGSSSSLSATSFLLVSLYHYEPFYQINLWANNFFSYFFCCKATAITAYAIRSSIWWTEPTTDSNYSQHQLTFPISVTSDPWNKRFLFLLILKCKRGTTALAWPTMIWQPIVTWMG